MGNPIWKGSRNLEETPDSPETYETGTDNGVIRRWEGPYEACHSARPDVGAAMAGYPGSRIKDWRLARLPGRRGRLTVTASIDPVEIPDDPGTVEIDWVRVSRKIESHPIFKDITDEDNKKIKEALDKPTSGQSPSLTDPAAIGLYTRLLKGQDSYDVWAPLIRKTTVHRAKPATGNCGMPDAPPVSVGGSWQYLKTGDSARQQGREWTRTQEWTGATEIDEEIYPSGTPTS